MKVRMLVACLLLGLGSALWLGCRVDRNADPVGVGSADAPMTAAKPNSAVGSGTVHANFGMQAVANVKAETEGCSNNPGPHIRVNGELKLGGVNARLVFSNNAKFTHMHEEDVVVDVVLVPEGESFMFDKQPSRGGPGGNPWIYLAFTDGDGGYYGKPQLLGRCVQGLFATTASLEIPSGASAEVETGGCSNRGGPTITVNGELALGGINAELIFTNNRKFRHVTKEDVTVSIVILPAGQSIEFTKRPPDGGAGGNPHVYMQFQTGGGTALSEMFYLGRCVQLGG